MNNQKGSVVALFILITIHIVGWLTAYPKNKRFVIKEGITRFPTDVWKRIDAIEVLLMCFFFWWIVWACYIFNKIENFIKDNEWLNGKV